MSPRILVTCSRSWRNWSQVRRVLTRLHAAQPGAVLVHGAAQRGDQQVAGIWRSWGGVDEPHPVRSWGACVPECAHPQRYRQGRPYCPAAGLRRNARMVESNPDLVVAFIRDKSAGATHTYNLAKGAGLHCLPPYVDDDTEEES